MAKIEIVVSGRDEASGVLGKVRGALGGLGGAVGGAVSGLGALGLAGMGIQTLASSVGGLVSAMTSGNAAFETYTTQFGVLLGSTEKAKARLDELSKFAASTPFELPDVVEASKVLQTLGGDALATGKNLTLIGDMASTAGVGFQEMAVTTGRMYDAIKSGRPFGESAARLQELGILSGEMRGKLEAMQKAGVSGTKMWETFANTVGSKVGGMMQKQSQTFDGMVSNLQDFIGQTQRALTAPLFDAIKPQLAGLLTMLNSPETQAAIKNLATSIGTAIGQIIALFQRLSTTEGPQVAGIISTIGAFATTTLIPALQSMYNWFAANLLPILQQFAVEVAPIVRDLIQSISDIMNNFLLPVLKEIVPQFVEWAGPVLKEGLVVALGLAKTALTLLRDMFVALQNALPGPQEAIRSIRMGADALGTTFRNLIGNISSLIGWFRDLGNALPDWLRGKSPPPLANWLDYVADSMTGVALAGQMAQGRTMLGGRTLAPAAIGAAGGRTTNLYLNVGSVDKRQRVDEIAREVMYALERQGRYRGDWTGRPR